MPLVTLLMHLRNQDSAEQTVQGSDVSKEIRICDAKWDNMEMNCLNGFAMLSIAVDCRRAKEKADEITLKMGIEFKCSKWMAEPFQGVMKHNMASHEWGW
jgi:hypothetical protein